MSVCQTLICFLLCLQVRSSPSDKMAHIYGEPGGDVTFPCPFLSPGTWRMFCRETCEGENFLIKTQQQTEQRGRYRTDYVKEPSQSIPVLYVSISGLTQSDSGLYRCGLGDSPSSASFQELRLVVTDALLDGDKSHHLYKDTNSSLTVACSFGDSGKTRSFCRGECEGNRILVQTDGLKNHQGRYSIEYNKGTNVHVLLVTIDQLTRSDSGLYRCLLRRTVRKDLFRDFNVTVRDVEPSTCSPSTTQGFSSASGTFKPSVSSEATNQMVLPQDNRRSGGASNHYVPLIVGLTLSVAVVVLAAALLVSYRRRSRGDLSPTETTVSDHKSASYVNIIF